MVVMTLYSSLYQHCIRKTQLHFSVPHASHIQVAQHQVYHGEWSPLHQAQLNLRVLCLQYSVSNGFMAAHVTSDTICTVASRKNKGVRT